MALVTPCTLIISIVILLWSAATGLINKDGLCPLFVVVPFTYDDRDDLLYEISWNNFTLNVSVGLSHMAGALLAMEQFNARDASVVPELKEQLADCPIYFDMNRTKFFDSRSGVGHAVSRQVAQDEITPCAIAGPFSDVAALDLSALAQAFEYPLVAHRAYNNRVASQDESPFSSQVFPDLDATFHALLSYLLYQKREDYISLVYPATEVGTQRREAFTSLLDEKKMSWFATPYLATNNKDDEDFMKLINSTTRALQRVKERGYRTVVISTDESAVKDILALAEAAEILQMNGGEYFYIWLGLLDIVHELVDSPAVMKLMRGSAWLAAGENYFIDHENDPFYQAWVSFPPDFVKRLNEFNPIAPGEPGYVKATEITFPLTFPEWGTGLIADAVMSIGIGACLAAAEKNKNATLPLSGQEHLDGIRAVNFRGYSSPVRFSPDSKSRPGAKHPDAVYWAVFNLQPELPDFMNITDTKIGLGPWERLANSTFVFADGRTVPPMPLRNPPDQNYISDGLQVFGLALMSIAMLLGLFTLVWVYLHRKHRVLLAAQPLFLYLIVFGSMVTASTILPMSFDESDGWSEDQLSAACMAIPWLLTLGHIITYGALFAKLRRVNRVLTFSRRRRSFWIEIRPYAFLVFCAVIFLIIWNVFDPVQWERNVEDDDTGESFGRCSGGVSGVTSFLMLIATALAAWYAWKTRDVDDAYSESYWILILIVIQVQIIVLAVPIIIILTDLSTDGRYFGSLLVIWTLPMSTLLVIMVPKWKAHYRAFHPDTHPVRGSGGVGRVNVTGIAAQGAREPVTSSRTNAHTDRSSIEETARHSEDQRGSDASVTVVLEVKNERVSDSVTKPGDP